MEFVQDWSWKRDDFHWTNRMENRELQTWVSTYLQSLFLSYINCVLISIFCVLKKYILGSHGTCSWKGGTAGPITPLNFGPDKSKIIKWPLSFVCPSAVTVFKLKWPFLGEWRPPIFRQFFLCEKIWLEIFEKL